MIDVRSNSAAYSSWAGCLPFALFWRGAAVSLGRRWTFWATTVSGWGSQ